MTKTILRTAQSETSNPPARTDGRFFTAKQKRHLFIASGGKCKHCREPLPPRWHAHHVTPYSAGGKTTLNNGMCLCESCHQDIHKETVK